MLAQDLLDQSNHLIYKEPRKPLQASLRRAVSTAYYALFHLLIEDGVSLLISGAGRKTYAIELAMRAFQHGQMRNICEEIVKPNLTASLKKVFPQPPSIHLKQLSIYFIELQKARHKADYDAFSKWSRNEAAIYSTKTQMAFQLWQTLKNTPKAALFVGLMLFGRPRD